MIGISTTTYYYGEGRLKIKEFSDSNIDVMPARVQVTKTLDGGVVVNHQGFCHGDRPISIKSRLTETEAELLKTIHQNETLISISMKDGYYSGSITNLSIDGGELLMGLVLEEKLSA